MDTPTPRVARPAVGLLTFLLGTAAFTVAYCQAPLFYSNQNQYFLHGMAKAGWGSLSEDWLANTADPTPGFSLLVELTAKHLPLWAFHAYHALLLGFYAWSMFGLFVHLAGDELAARRWPAFCLLLLAAHSAVARWGSYQLVNFDYPWFLQAGVAGQYVLGGMLQPSLFGVMLVVAVCLFARGRPVYAAVCVAAACLAHSTYLLPGALLTLGFLASLLARKQVKVALMTGATALALVLPAVAYVMFHFGPSSPEAFAEARDIIVNLRIPHHSRVDLWLDWVAGAQIAWVIVAIALTHRSPLFLALGVPFALSAALTAVQAATGDTALAMLFPWRVSSVLVPIATTVILSKLVTLPWPPLDSTLARGASLVGLAALVAGGAWISANGLGYHMDDADLPVMAFVRGQPTRGHVYLLPVRLPDSTKRGSLSSDFKPLPKKKQDTQVIPVELQRFRLHAGAAIFVDFKSIPYKDTDVIEWRDRLRQAQAIYADLAEGRASMQQLRHLGITHVVKPTAAKLAAPGLKKVYEDAAYQVYRLPPPLEPE
jgi:hypothetical protein